MRGFVCQKDIYGYNERTMTDTHSKKPKKNIDHDDVLDIEQDVVFEEEGETPSDSLKKLREKLKVCQSERAEYLAGWQRAKADFVNARKEEEKNRLEFKKFANKELILEMLTVVDSFDMAFANKEAWEKVDKNWRMGVEYIYNNLLGIMEQHGVQKLVPTGEMFDPKIHTSVESIPVESKNDDHKIIAVASNGYTLDGVVVRSPKVKVGVFDSTE
jgi:molecular chaperone GrpE